MGDLSRQKINWLALFIPLAFAISYVPSWQNELLLFWCSVIGLIVTSAWIGTATEQLARVKLGDESNGIDAEAIVASPDEESRRVVARERRPALSRQYIRQAIPALGERALAREFGVGRRRRIVPPIFAIPAQSPWS